MDKQGVEKAQARLRSAELALAHLKDSKTFDEFERAWTSLLANLNTVYTALEQAAKSGPKSRQWFGGKKRQRRKDPLLGYFHQARNSDEHGIEQITAREHGALAIGRRGEETHIESAIFDGTRTKIILHPTSTGTTVSLIPDRVRLLPVIDTRFGDKFDPPKEHLGHKLSDLSIAGLASTAVEAHRQLVEEAEKLII